MTSNSPEDVLESCPACLQATLEEHTDFHGMDIFFNRHCKACGYHARFVI